MSIEEKINMKNAELQQKIISEIKKVKEGQSKKNILQLQTILIELQRSCEERNIPLYYPRIIIDSWDYSGQLGIDLIEFAELYKKYSDS